MSKTWVQLCKTDLAQANREWDAIVDATMRLPALSTKENAVPSSNYLSTADNSGVTRLKRLGPDAPVLRPEFSCLKSSEPFVEHLSHEESIEQVVELFAAGKDLPRERRPLAKVSFILF